MLEAPLLFGLLQIVMLRNEVRECRASGVFLRLAAQGLIAENDIHANGEAGLDIRKGANPIIVVIPTALVRDEVTRHSQMQMFTSSLWSKCNRIHSGLRSGVVVLGNGKGSLRSNRIYNNKEAGVYILFSGNPVVR